MSTQESQYIRAQNFKERADGSDHSLYAFIANVSGVSDVRNQIIFAKSTNPVYALPNVGFSNTVFSVSDYVRTVEGKVYICVGKRSTANTAGTVYPRSTGSSPQLINGYYWKYLFTSGRTFYSDTYFEVVESPNAANAVAGEIFAAEVITAPVTTQANLESITLVTDGTGFAANIVSAQVAANVYIANTIQIANAGSHHTNVWTYTIPSATTSNANIKWFITSDPAEEANVFDTLKPNTIIAPCSFNPTDFVANNYSVGTQPNKYLTVGLWWDPKVSATDQLASGYSYRCTYQIFGNCSAEVEPGQHFIRNVNGANTEALVAVSNWRRTGDTYGNANVDLVLSDDYQPYYPTSWNVAYQANTSAFSGFVNADGNVSTVITDILDLREPELDVRSGEILMTKNLATGILRSNTQIDLVDLKLKFTSG
jgi:hypothetical protein